MYTHTPSRERRFFERQMAQMPNSTLHRPHGYAPVEPANSKYCAIRDYRLRGVGSTRVRGLRTWRVSG